MTDAAILDWMEREGLESIIRVPTHDGKGGYVWASMWTPAISAKQVYLSLREAAIAGMIESAKERR